MSSSALLLVAAIIAQDAPAPGPPAGDQPPAATRAITLETLAGEQVDVESVQKLSNETLELTTAEGPRTVATQDLQTLRWSDSRTEGAVPPEMASIIEVQLQDDSIVRPTGFEVQQRMARLVTPHGEINLPSSAVRVVRLAAMEEALATAWADLVARDARNDLLILRKGEALEFVGGVVGEISETDVKLLVRDREAAVPRERVFGVIFVRAAEAPPPAVCEVQTTSGDRLRTREIGLAGDSVTLRLANQASVSVPLSEVSSIDFTLGRIKALGDLPMEQKQHAASLILTSSVFEVRRDRTSLGQPLRIGNRDFTNGLWMHSGATATFRLQRQFRRFTAVMGLDANSPELPRVAPEVKVTISGDGQPLIETNVAWDDEPRSLDLDVSGVRDLEIRVDSPRDTPGILEHLDLGDARLIK